MNSHLHHQWLRRRPNDEHRPQPEQSHRTAGLLLCVLLGKGPILLIRDSFIELAGGTLQDGQGRARIEATLRRHLPQPGLLTSSYISKTGSQYLVVAYLDVAIVEQLGAERVREIRRQIVADLGRDYPSMLFETVLA